MPNEAASRREKESSAKEEERAMKGAMRGAFVLTPSESKRFIAKAEVQLPKVKKAFAEGEIVIDPHRLPAAGRRRSGAMDNFLNS